jgi:hypothetical protein
VTATLRVIPVSLNEANAFVLQYHRHHRPVPGHKYSIGIERIDDGMLVGVAIVGRPRSRYLDDGLSLEVIRACTDGEPHANSMLYGASWRAARAQGYQRMYTYILQDEPGTSLKAAGWTRIEGLRGGGSWHAPSRPRGAPSYPTEQKVLWQVEVDNARRTKNNRAFLSSVAKVSE